MEHHLTTYITHDTLISALGFGTQENPVSYTHLTLPTNREVEISTVVVTLKKKKVKRIRGHGGDNGEH